MEADLQEKTERRPFVLHYELVTEDNEFFPDGFGGFTIAVTDEGVIGWSFCQPWNRFSRKEGIKYALKRMEEKPEVDVSIDWKNLHYEDKLEEVDLRAYEIFNDNISLVKEGVDIVPRKKSVRNRWSQEEECKQEIGFVRRLLESLFG